MKNKLLNWIVCPSCKGKLEVILQEENDKREIKEGSLYCQCGKYYPIKDYIPRFIENNQYVNSFSFEWRMHKKTQLDSANRNRISEKAFQAQIGFPLEGFKGKLVLDAGCGTGRFTEIVAKYGGTVVGFDLSDSIEVAIENIGFRKNTYLIQADVFNLPFRDNTFDFIYSFGVIHHTPDCKKAFKQLPGLLKKGGGISIFVYSSYNKGIVYTSNFWRAFTTRLPKRLLYYLCFVSVPLYFVYKIPILGDISKMLFVISMQPNWKWRVLDTFDWYSPKYQSKHTHAEVFRWFDEEGLRDIKIFDGEVCMMGTKS